MGFDKFIMCPHCKSPVGLYYNQPYGDYIWGESDKHRVICDINWVTIINNIDNPKAELNSTGIYVNRNLHELQQRINNYYPIWKQLHALDSF